MQNEIREDMLKVKRMVSEVEMIIGKREGETELVNKLIDAENLLTYCMSRMENAIVPPYKVGDTVYCINTFFQNDPRINICEVDALHITSGKNRRGHKKPSYALVRDINMHSLSSRIYFEKFGTSAFLTREEAEKALAERQTP